MYYDLHIHTTASDGLLTPKEIIKLSEDIGLLGISLTDHDTIDGIEETINEINLTQSNLEFIPGIELNAEVNEIETHILGYFIDNKNENLVNRLKDIKTYRYERAEKMIKKLHKMGLIINLEQVKKYTQSNLIGRPHIAQALIDKAYVFSIKEAFDKYLGYGKRAYVPRYKFVPEEAIELIRNAGGISILAHPGLIKNTGIVNKIIDMGIDGIEVYYPEHSSSEIKSYLNICNKKNLLITGGSDFHGYNSIESKGRLGCTGVKQLDMDRIKNYADKIKNN